MKRFLFSIACILISISGSLSADGLLLSSTKGYPKDLLKNRMTKVSITMNGQIAETVVYQEFVNEWTQNTDAVYSFPLPPDARATAFYYWRNDTLFKAVLKVQQQTTNPGTGEEGNAALVNKYIGRNGLRIQLCGIPPGSIQKVQLHYVSVCPYNHGECVYRFPLGAGEFITYPLEHLQFSIDVHSTTNILSYQMISHPAFKEILHDANRLQIEMTAPKAYVDRDFEFRYTLSNDSLNVDFYSAANDSLDGHFVMFVRPPAVIDSNNVLPKRIIFALCNSGRMSTYQLEASKEAIRKALDMLSPGDQFNVIVFNSYIYKWKDAPLDAAQTNIQSAKSYINGITAQYGSRLDMAFNEALKQIQSDDFNNIILAFTDGRSPVKPKDVAASNIFKTGIFIIGIGDDLDRERLEMTAALNFGNVTYLSLSDNLTAGITNVFRLINKPMLKDVKTEFAQDNVYGIRPSTLSSLYAGSFIALAGRYKKSGESPLAIFGKSIFGSAEYDFQLHFNSQKKTNTFTESIWAKFIIDDLEREIEVYGETPQLKDSLIAISLRYGIRCRYTAYIADYKNVVSTAIEKSESDISIPGSYIVGNYPNPFSYQTSITIYISGIDPASAAKYLRIYNILGQLVAVFDITHLAAGMHQITFTAVGLDGKKLPAGLYIVQLQSGNAMCTKTIMIVR